LIDQNANLQLISEQLAKDLPHGYGSLCHSSSTNANVKLRLVATKKDESAGAGFVVP
jgi:hypothetical protein